MAFNGQSPTVIRNRFTPQAAAPSNPLEGDVYYDNGTTNVEGLYVYRNLQWDLIVASGQNSISAQNYIMNGDFNIWQTGTSFASIANGTYFADGFQYFLTNSTAVCTIAQNTSVPTVSTSVTQFKYSARLTVGTADASVAAGDRVFIAQKIEGSLYKFIHDKQVTLSFWVYATKTGTSCVSFRNNAGDRSYIAEYTVSVTNTWEFKTITITTDSSGTWDFTDGTIGLFVSWAAMAGSTYQTTAGSWQAGNFLATSNQVNHVDSTSNIFAITGVKLNPGPIATGFTLAAWTPQGELDFCMRYCQVPYLANGDSLGSGQCTSTTAASVYHALKVPMAASPTLTVSNVAHFGLTDSTGGVVATTNLTLNAASSNYAAQFSATVSSGLTAGNGTVLFLNNASATLFLTARL